MDSVIITPRLKLTLVTEAERGSAEFQWMHDLRSNEQTTWWSILGTSKSPEDTEKLLKNILPTDEGDKKYRVLYAIHKYSDAVDDSHIDGQQPEERGERPTEFIGTVNLVNIDANKLPLSESLTLPASAAATTLTLELAYQFLPSGWGKGFATESVMAMCEACRRAPSFWAPFSKVYVRVIVNEGNPASLRVMEKTGMTRKGVFHWKGKIFLAGKWRTEDNLHIFGLHLLE